MTIFLGALPVLAFAIWVVVMRRLCVFGNAVAPLRETFVTVAPLWAAWLVLGTELLSLFSAINRPMLALWWMIPIAVGACMFLRRRQPPTEAVVAERWKIIDYVLMAILILIIAACGISAGVSPPMNYDSLSYHLPRIIFWAQNHNLGYFSTNNLRQIMMSPYAEYVGMHFMILSGSDAFLNLIQWFALILTVVGVSIIAQQLGASRAGQIFAAIIVATIPAVFLEASNTKNDVIEAMWSIIAAYWAFTFLTRTKDAVPRAALLGIAIGAAVLTKGTGSMFAVPVAAVAGIALLRDERAMAIIPLLLIGFLAVAFNAGYFCRNYRQFSQISGQKDAYGVVNVVKTPTATTSNMLRMFAIEAGTPWPAVNAWMDDAINTVHRWIGIDPQDPRFTVAYSTYTGVTYFPHEEDRAGSPAHVALALISFPMLFLVRRRIRFSRVLLVYGLGAATFVVFCAVLRWQQWNTRLIFPSICLMAPAMAAIWTARGAVYCSPLLVMGLLAGLVPTIMENDRPLWGSRNIFTTPRAQLRFHYWRPDEIPIFQQEVRLIASKHPKRIAFATDGNSPDYLMMHMILDAVKPAPVFEYINPVVKVNGSMTFPPDVIIGGPGFTAMTDPSTRRLFVNVLQNDWFSILVPGTLDEMYKPPFQGFDVVSGLNHLEGPYLQWNLPQVRWGTYPETRLNIPWKQTGGAELYMEARRNDSSAQSLTIILNGTQLAAHAFSASFQFEMIRVPLPLHAGGNLLVIKYANEDHDASPPGRAVLFRVLRVRPAPATTAAATSAVVR